MFLGPEGAKVPTLPPLPQYPLSTLLLDIISVYMNKVYHPFILRIVKSYGSWCIWISYPTR